MPTWSRCANGNTNAVRPSVRIHPTRLSHRVLFWSMMAVSIALTLGPERAGSWYSFVFEVSGRLESTGGTLSL